MSIPVFHIPTTPEQLRAAMTSQGNVLFQAGVNTVIAAGAQAVTEYALFNKAEVRNGYRTPDWQTGGGLIPNTPLSDLNTPVMGNLDINAGNYTYPSPDGTPITYTYNGILVDTVLFQVSQDKNIVKTAIQGQAGTIKEYIQQGDFKIQVHGVICGTNGTYPLNEINVLRSILIAPVALSINSKFLSIFGIKSVVVESYEFPQEKGSYSYQTFNITFISDLPLAITINQSTS